MDELILKQDTYLKFKNHLLPELPDIIFNGFIENKLLLERINNTYIDIEEFIHKLICNYKGEEDINHYIIKMLIKYIEG